MIGLDIVVVNWNTGSRLQECLSSIPAASPASAFRLGRCIVVDNASHDASADNLQVPGLSLEIIRNQENKGFAFACNQGARIASSEYMLFLNPDTRLFSESLTHSLSFLEDRQNEGIGILGIQLVDGKGTVQRNVARFPTPASLFSQMLGLDRLWPQHFPAYFMREWDHLENRVVDQVEGAFFLVRRKVFEQLHGFDERFFMYFEDLDFACRANQAGWKSYYLADTRAIHYGGIASSQIKARRLAYVLSSRTRYVARHFSLSAALAILIASFGIELWIRLGWCIIGLSWHNFIDTLYAYGLFLRMTPNLIRELGNQ